MTQEEKSLLLQDLATRLPYGVKVYINSCIDEQNQMKLFDVDFASETIGVGNEKWAFRAIPIVDIDNSTKIVKPYLRPMSSMTEDEISDLQKITSQFCFNKFDNSAYVGAADDGFCSVEEMANILNYLNSKHFDFRGLIPAGLAIEVTKENNPYEV